MRLATAQQLRWADQEAIVGRKIPSTLLMERAAEGILAAVLTLLGAPEKSRAAVFCGPGNNGGDGVAVARLLRKRGVTVRAILVGKREKMTGDCREMERRLMEYGGVLEPFDPEKGEQATFCQSCQVLVDAVFGIGLNSPLRGDGLLAVRRMNDCPAPVVAADIPSGLAADTGLVLGECVKCAKTVTFSRAKPGMFAGKGRIFCGKVIVHDIGIPADILSAMGEELTAVEEPLAAGILPVRDEDTHKGDYGKVAILAGSVGYTGAPVMAAKAAVRSGAGLVTLLAPEEIYPILAVKCDEVMPSPVSSGRGKVSPQALPELREKLAGKTACLIGPGLGRGEEVEQVVCTLLEELPCPIVLDADGLNAAAAHIDSLDSRRGRVTILTPHDGEFARLGGDLSSGDRIGAAREFARKHGCILVLKGHCTVTALPDGGVYLNTTGNSGMAKGGSGDILSGILLSLVGQGIEPGKAAALAVWIHGRAGDLCAQVKGKYGMIPTDLLLMLPRVLQQLEKER